MSNKVELNILIQELDRESIPWRIINFLGRIKVVAQDLLFAVPQVIFGFRNMMQLHQKKWERPTYIPLDDEIPFPAEMNLEYKNQLAMNIHAISSTCRHRVYYTTNENEIPCEALATATGVIVIDPSICTVSEKVAQAIVYHESSHVLHKDGYSTFVLTLIAAITRIAILCISPWHIVWTSPLLSYVTIRYSQYVELRADRHSIQTMKDSKPMQSYLLGHAEKLTKELIQAINHSNPRSYCNLQNYEQLNTKEQMAIHIKISHLGIREVSHFPNFDHPTYIERHKNLSHTIYQN